MSRMRINKKTKSIISIVLVIALIIASCGVLGTIFKIDTKTIHSSAFKVGGLDETTGEYKNDNQSIYTKNSFKCVGLRVEPDFESNVVYDVYYYDHDERLIEVVPGLTSVYDEDFPMAEYARIVIHPEIPEDVKANDFEVKIWDIPEIAGKLKITVNRNQEHLYGECINLYNDDAAQKGYTIDAENANVGNAVSIIEGENFKVSEKIELDADFEYVDVYIRASYYGSSTGVIIVTSSDDKVVSKSWYNASDFTAGEWCKVTVEIPESDVDQALYIRLPITAECYIFGY